MLAAASPTALNPPIQYAAIWLILGSILFGLILIWYGVVFWMTRRQAVNTIAGLPQLPDSLDLPGLKNKYLKLIDACYQAYQSKKVTKRKLHQDLSSTVRSFVYEASYMPATRMTLADFEMLPYPALTELIGDYYVDEFASIEKGEAEQSVAAAKRLVERWA